MSYAAEVSAILAAHQESMKDQDYNDLYTKADDVLSQVPVLSSYKKQPRPRERVESIPLNVSERDLSAMISVYDEAGANEILTPANPPIDKWTPEQQTAYFESIGSVARLIEKRTIRPADIGMQRELREREMSNAARTNKSTPALFRGETLESTYATDGPTCWDDKKAFGATQISTIEHSHAHPMTSIPDIRVLRGSTSLKLMYEPFEELDTLANPMASFLMLTAKDNEAVHRCSAHLEVEKLVRWAIEGSMVGSLEYILSIAKTQHMLSLHAVVFRHDNTVELVFSLDLVGRYFAVISLRNQSPAAKAAHNAVKREKALRDTAVVNGQLRATATHEIKMACQPQPDQGPTEDTIGDAAKRRETEFLLAKLAVASGALFDSSGEVQMIDLSSIGRAEYEQTRGQFGVPETGKDIRMMARNALLYVYLPAMSPQLMANQFSISYHYFVGCQCCFGRKDKTRFKKNHARAVRQDSSMFVTLVSPQTLPSFGSDDEKETDSKSKSAATTTVQTQAEKDTQLQETRYAGPKRTRK